MIYRSFHIEENWLGQWEWTHEDYDGHNDPRHGHDRSEEEARASVDDWWAREAGL